MPNKSDYYRHMDPVTLSPKTVNPWRNPMKTGIVSPAYDAAATQNYLYGYPTATSAGNPTVARLYSVDDGAVGNNAGGSWIVLNPWNVTPGVRTINSVKIRIGFTTSTYLSAAYIEVWRLNGATYERVAASADLGPFGGTNYARTTLTPASPLSITIESGYEYFVGVRMVRTSANPDTPYLALTNDNDFTKPCLRFVTKNTYDLTSGIPVDGVADNALVYASDAFHVLLEVDYNSDRFIEQDITADTIGKYTLARPVATNYVTKLETVVVTDGEALTIAQKTISTVNGESAVTNTTELDCGDTTGGQKDLIDATNTINLPDIDPGGGAEGQEGKTFDLIDTIRPVTGKADLFWQNRTLETSVHSHAVKNAGSRGSLYTYVGGHIIQISGTATGGKVRVGTKPIVLVGDSQTMIGGTNTLRYPNVNRWGGVPTRLSKERIWVMCGQSGGYVATTILDAFSNATPGSGDLVEMCGVGCEWFFAAPGLNDISNLTTASYSDSRQAVAQIIADIAYMLESITNAGDGVLLAGLPPYSSQANADKYEAAAVRWLNRAFLGLALANKYPFYNSWPDMVERGTEGNDIPTFAAANTVDAGTHFSNTGGRFAADGMVSAYERSTIDLRDAWD